MKKRSSLLISAVLGFSSLVGAPCYGIESSWKGGGTNANWNTSGNWSNGIPGASTTSDQTEDVAVFSASDATTTAVNVTSAGWNIGGIRFNEDADEDVTVTLAGNLRLRHDIIVESGSGGEHRITESTSGINLRLGAVNETAGSYTYSILNHSASLFTIDVSFIAPSGSTNRTVNLTLGGAGDSVIGAKINGPFASVNPIHVEKVGSGTVTLASSSGSNYVNTTVSAGTLLLTNATESGTGTGAVSVASGAAIGGSGRIATTGTGLTLNGTLIAGLTATDTFDLHGAVTFGETSRIQLVLGADGASSSLVRESGNWTFSANQEVEFTFLPGAAGGSYTDLITGLASDPGVASWTIINEGWSGQFQWADGNVGVVLTAIPEPSTLGMIGLVAGVGLGYRVRRKRTGVL